MDRAAPAGIGGTVRAFRWLVVVAVVVLIAVVVFSWMRWQDHARRVERLQTAARSANHLASVYKALVDRIEARRVLSNQLVDRFFAAEDRARGGPIGGIATVRDRLDSLRHGDRFDDVVAYARASLPPAERRKLDSDFTVLLKRQEDASDATEIVSSTLQQLLANPWARLGFSDADRDKMWKGFDDARAAFNKAFEKMQLDVYERDRVALTSASSAATEVGAAQRASLLQSMMAP